MAIAQRRTDGATVVEVTLTSTYISDRFFDLPITPTAPEKVTLDVIGGGSQSLNTDFQIIGARISWVAMGLETILSIGDKVRVILHE